MSPPRLRIIIKSNEKIPIKPANTIPVILFIKKLTNIAIMLRIRKRNSKTSRIV